jgi:hypothetical protein
MSNPILPHTHSYVRLGTSKIQGIGVFAIRDIPLGTNIFSDDQLGVGWFDREEVDGQVTDSELKKFYSDFCILKDGRYGCPVNFNSMTMGWYMNEPAPGDTPNTQATDGYDFLATRDIKKGEELTTLYSTFSEVLERY